MKRVMILLLLCASVSYADDANSANSFVQGFAQALQRQIEARQGQQPPQVIYVQTSPNPINTYDPTLQQALQMEQQELDLQRQQLQEQQTQNAWWNK